MRRTESVEGLELISHVPASPAHPVPLLFVHGAFVAAWCWDDYFLPYFEKQGYTACALSLRGHGASRGRDDMLSASIDDYESDLLRVARHIAGPVVVVGHSMGGMVVQRCLHRMDAAAAVLMAPVPTEGLLGSSFLLAARDPALFQEINVIQYANPKFDSMQGMRHAVFSDRVAGADLNRHFARMQPESQRAVFDLSWPQHFFVGHASDVPVLVLGGGKDAFFPPSMIESTARIYGGRPQIFPEMGHAMMLEPDWQQAADHIIGWLEGLGI